MGPENESATREGARSGRRIVKTFANISAAEFFKCQEVKHSRWTGNAASRLFRPISQ
jgi:hypothetical protein